MVRLVQIANGSARRVALVESIQNLATFYKALQALPRSTSTADLSEWFEHLIDQV